MKKICFITTAPTTIESFVLKTAMYIHEHTDWDISFVCNEDEKFKTSLPEYIHYHPVRMERGISIAGVKAMLQMMKIFRQEHFHLIQYSTPNASLYASLAGWFARIPVRLYCQWGMVFVGFEGLKRRIFKFEERIVCALSTWIEPDSMSNLRFAHIERLYPESKGSVIWNGSACGVDLAKFDYGKKQVYRQEVREQYHIEDGSFVFGFVGRITRDKGVNEMFSAFKKILEHNENTYLFLVGRPEIDASVDGKLYEWAKGNKRIIFTGYTNTVEKYLAAMDCFILPSYREGFGMGVVEAEAMGVPVIVTNIPGPIDAMVDGKTGLIVEKKEIDGLVFAMKKLRENMVFCEQLGNAGVEYARSNFEQNQLFKKILEDRKKLLG